MPTEVLVPPLGTNVDTLTLVTWYRREGDPVEKNEPLFAVQTDKATLDVEAPASGILRAVTAEPGAEVAALSCIAVIAAAGEDPCLSDCVVECLSGEPAERPAHSITQPLNSPITAPTDRTFISPRARRLAEDRRLEWRGLRGSGPEGAIVERDVRAELASLETQEGEAIPLTGIRAVIAARMLESATTTAPVTLTTETDATALVDLRRRLREEGTPVSYNDLLLVILGRALREHPRLNAALEGDTIRLRERVDVGVAVDADAGLLVPVVRGVDRKPLAEIARETAALVEAARAGRLPPDSMRGGTFTLTNLGMYGIDAFTPVINLPECGVLGVGRIKPQPAVVGDEIRIRQRMWLSLTFDHRLVDGGPAARFLQRVAQLIEDAELGDGAAGSGA